MEDHGLSFDDAERLIKEKDRVRLSFVEEYYKVPWGDINAFDMVINTAKVPSDLAVRWISETVHQMEENSEPNVLTTDNIIVDRILLNAVSEKLEQLILLNK
jgi:cytidylate kinase